jgi:hypothetical protein
MSRHKRRACQEFEVKFNECASGYEDQLEKLKQVIIFQEKLF